MTNIIKAGDYVVLKGALSAVYRVGTVRTTVAELFTTDSSRSSSIGLYGLDKLAHPTEDQLAACDER